MRTFFIRVMRMRHFIKSIYYLRNSQKWVNFIIKNVVNSLKPDTSLKFKKLFRELFFNEFRVRTCSFKNLFFIFKFLSWWCVALNIRCCFVIRSFLMCSLINIFFFFFVVAIQILFLEEYQKWRQGQMIIKDVFKLT